MPGQTCAVIWCKSNRLNLKKDGVNLSFHSFPKANNAVSSTIRKEWILRCKRKDKFNPDTSTICSLHFTPNDYERDFQNELLGLPLRRILKKTAVPTLKLNSNEKPIAKTPRATRAEKRRQKGMVESLLSKASFSNPEASQLVDVRSTPTAATPRAKRAEKRRKKGMVESLLSKASFSNPEASQLLDVRSTSTAGTSYTKKPDKPNISSTQDNQDINKRRFEELLFTYNHRKSTSNRKIKR